MRHRVRGRKLGRNHSHRKAMFRNMACSLLRTARIYEDDEGNPEKGSAKVPGRIVTTVAKAKELRPKIEKLITMARKAIVIEEKARKYGTDADRNTDAWKAWRDSEKWHEWANAIAPAVAIRRRAFAELRDHEALDILFDEIANRFADRAGGYTRVVRIAERRLGDAGEQAFIEFVGENDRVSSKSAPAPVVTDDDDDDSDEPISATDDDADTADDATAGPTAEDETATETEEPAEAEEKTEG